VTLPDAEALYIALIGDPKRLKTLRRLQYRCSRDDRCLLLDAVAIGDTVLLHQKRFKNSPEVNVRRSSESGRAANTFDGRNHWKPRTYYIASSALNYPDENPPPRQSIQCDHVGVTGAGDDVCLTAADFQGDWTAGHAEVVVRADGTRYAVR
jgi:hypothetical protein